MTSKLVTIAKLFASSKQAAAIRSAPAAIVGSIQGIFHSNFDNKEDKEEEDNIQQQENSEQQEQNYSEPAERSGGSIPNGVHMFSGLVANSSGSGGLAASTPATPIESPFDARELLRDFRHEYYQRAAADNNSNRRDPLQNPDLSIPVVGEDDYLFLVQ